MTVQIAKYIVKYIVMRIVKYILILLLSLKNGCEKTKTMPKKKLNQVYINQMKSFENGEMNSYNRVLL